MEKASEMNMNDVLDSRQIHADQEDRLRTALELLVRHLLAELSHTSQPKPYISSEQTQPASPQCKVDMVG